MGREKDEPKEDTRLDWRDYLAIVVASFETTLLPVLGIIAGMIILVLILKMMNGR